MYLSAGSKSDLERGAGPWVVLDIGFSKNPSCGLKLGSNEPEQVNFGEACRSAAAWINDQQSQVNLMIEAPLSMAFDLKGNPIPRKVDKNPSKIGSQTRPWYCGPGATVLIATLHLISHLRDNCPDASIRLFEGFVSFKPSEAKSNHICDAKMLAESVGSGPTEIVEYWDEEDLRAPGTVLKSVFTPCGFDPGIPAIVRVVKSGDSETT